VSDEQIFRWLTVAILVVGFPIGLFFRLRAATGESLDRKPEGWLFIPLRLCGLAFFGGLLAYLIDPEWMAWAQLPLPAAVRWAGVGVAVLALPLMVWTFASLGRNLTDTVATRRQHTLVTTGPYRWVRHPFYTSGFSIYLALILLTANGWLALAGVGALILLCLRTPTEEKKLIERFGDEYRAYAARTGRYFPRLFVA